MNWLLGHSMYSVSVYISAININKQTVCKYCGHTSKHSYNTKDSDYSDNHEQYEVKLSSNHNKQGFIKSSGRHNDSCPVIL